MTLDTSTPVLLLGGKENSLSVTRHLGGLGVTVRVSGPECCWGLYSRHCAEAIPVPLGEKQVSFWTRLLLGNDTRFNGHIVLALSDDAIEFVTHNHDRLATRYRLDDFDPSLAQRFLDKLETLLIAQAAGVGTPKFWKIGAACDIEGLRGKITFPAIVKPLQSHLFTKVFRQKLFVIDSEFDELKAKVQLARQHGIDVFIVEMIPGPDDLLSSYYTYRLANGEKLFHFTKSILRRWPVNRGNACYHRTGVYPETQAAGEKFFDAAGLRGLGNVEFKRDPRDGQLKIIEVNARFTAAQELATRAGVPIDLVVYCHLTGQPLPETRQATGELRFWYPLRDFLAFLEMRKRGELRIVPWIKSLIHRDMVFPLFWLSDPVPTLGAGRAVLSRFWR